MGVNLYTNRVYLQSQNSRSLHNKLNDRAAKGLQDNFMNFKAESGRRLRQAREVKGWTLNDLAARVQ